MSKVTIAAAFLCDDVRREDNGKMIAIGIYGNRIFVNAFPAILRLSALTNVSFPSAGRHSFKVRLSVGGEMRQEVTIEAEVRWSGSDWVPLPFEPVQFYKPNEVSLALELDNGKWRKFLTVPIEVPTSPTA